jgi:hypothetical protein
VTHALDPLRLLHQLEHLRDAPLAARHHSLSLA